MPFLNVHIFANRAEFDQMHQRLCEDELGKGATLNYVTAIDLPDGRVYCLPYGKTVGYFGETETVEIPEQKEDSLKE